MITLIIRRSQRRAMMAFGKKIIAALKSIPLLETGIFLCFLTPYMISNYAALLCLIPYLYFIYSHRHVDPFIAYAVIAAALVVLLPILTYNVFVYILGTAIVAAFAYLLAAISKFLIFKIGDSILLTFVPCVVWAALLYLFDVGLVLSSMFDIGVLLPMSAPLVWYVGSKGLTILIVLFNSAIARYIIKKEMSSVLLAVVILAVFIASFIFSIMADPAALHADEKPTRTALIQGGLPKRSVFGYEDNLDERIRRYIDLSSAAGYDNIDLVVWPEYTFPIDAISRFPAKTRPVFDEIKRSGKTFIIGSMINDPAKKNTYYDGAFIIGGDGDIKETYYSNLPFVFSKGVTPRQFNGKPHIKNAGIVICWEEFSPKIFRDYVNAGAEYFITLMNDIDLDGSWLKRYVTFFPRARASESMRYLARSTQTGITQVIDPFGGVIKTIPSDQPGFLTADIYNIKKRTFYSVHGDIITRSFLLIMIFIFLVSGVIRKKVTVHE